MEVSSHAIVQHRIAGIKFTGAAFSNITHDHLDYHKTMQAYFEAKAALFTSEYAQKAVINIDDAYGEKLSNQTQLPVISVSRKKSSADCYLSVNVYGGECFLRGKDDFLQLEGLWQEFY